MITKDEVLKLSNLARISLDEKDMVYYQEQLKRVLGYFETLHKIDKPTLEEIKKTPFIEREDASYQDQKSIDRTLKNSPKALGRAFGVPSAIKST